MSTISPRAGRRGRRRRCRRRRGSTLQQPASSIHRRIVEGCTKAPWPSRSRCSAKRVGPKSSYSGSCISSPARAFTALPHRRFDGLPRPRCTTAASPATSQRRRIRRNWRGVIPNRRAASAAPSCPSCTCRISDTRSRSRKLIVNTSSLRARVRREHTRTRSEGGHFYFTVSGHFYCNATHQKERGLRDFVWAIEMQFRFVVAAAGCRSGSSSGDSLHRAARSTAVG